MSLCYLKTFYEGLWGVIIYHVGKIFWKTNISYPRKTLRTY